MSQCFKAGSRRYPDVRSDMASVFNSNPISASSASNLPGSERIVRRQGGHVLVRGFSRLQIPAVANDIHAQNKVALYNQYPLDHHLAPWLF